jgi:type II secretion system protein C
MANPLKKAAQLSQLSKYFPYLIVALLGLSTADLSIQKFRPMMLPSEAPPKKPNKSQNTRPTSSDVYRNIISKNIFNYDGKIPPALADSKIKKTNTDDGPAVPSNLPLKLMGTIVHANGKKSVATIDVKSKGKSLPFKVNGKIENIARILEIERRKVIFRNLNNNRKEYIEILKDFKMNFGVDNQKKSASLDGIEKTSSFDRSINRSLVEQFTKPSELPKLLKQARMKPNMGPNGSVEGFRFDWIKPGSPFEDLGFKVGDVIKGVNGEEINSPRKAMEAYNALKNNPNISLRVTRDGREESFNYQVR